MVHQYKLNGFNIVLDNWSGEVHAVDEVAYDIISLYERKEKEEIIDFILNKYNWNDGAFATSNLYKNVLEN